MLKVGLTGGIATGKSYVAAKLRARGIPVLDADALAHGVMAPGTEATMAIAARFGDDILSPDGSVNRAKLGPIVFADAAARRELEAIVHPAVHRATEAGIRAFELTGEYPMAVVDVPLLFETGGEKKFDRVIVTTCSVALQMQRMLERGLTEDAARQRIAAQLPADQKTSRADYVIDTSGSFIETDRQIDTVLASLTTSDL
jgi:dephospho-CoA kinase